MKEKEGFPGSTIDGTTEGAKYITITSSGIKREGEVSGGVFFTKEAAWSNYNLHLKEYLKDKNIIYWRKEPDCRVDNDLYLKDCSFGRQKKIIEGIEVFTIYSRLYAHSK